MTTPLDEIDRRLLALLRTDAREPIASLARKLGVSRGTAQNRLTRLEASGTVVGYTVRLKPTAGEHGVRALMSLSVEGNRTAAVLKVLRGEPGVVALHNTNGRWDIVAELRVESLEAFDAILARVRLLDGVANSETSLLLSSVKL